MDRVHERGQRPQGKLTEAARARAFALLGRNDPERPIAIDEQSVAEFAALGVTVEPDQVDEEEVVEVWDINADVFGAFLALETQWRVIALVGMEGTRIIRTGLDYAAVDVVLRRHGLEGRSPLDDIAVMEDATMTAHAEVANA